MILYHAGSSKLTSQHTDIKDLTACNKSYGKWEHIYFFSVACQLKLIFYLLESSLSFNNILLGMRKWNKELSWNNYVGNGKCSILDPGGIVLLWKNSACLLNASVFMKINSSKEEFFKGNNLCAEYRLPFSNFCYIWFTFLGVPLKTFGSKCYKISKVRHKSSSPTFFPSLVIKLSNEKYFTHTQLC